MIKLGKITVFISLLLPCMVSAHDLVSGQRVPPTGVADKGELVLQHDAFSFRAWNSAQLPGKVRVIQHIAGRASAREQNAALVEALKAAQLPHDRYQTTTIVNADDAIPATGLFVRHSVESNKQRFPWSQFIIDSNGDVRRAWQLKSGGSAIIVLDRTGRVRFVQEGALSPDEIRQVMTLLHQLLG